VAEDKARFIFTLARTSVSSMMPLVNANSNRGSCPSSSACEAWDGKKNLSGYSSETVSLSNLVRKELAMDIVMAHKIVSYRGGDGHDDLSATFTGGELVATCARANAENSVNGRLILVDLSR
jgi:hypothetical protein